MNFSGTRRKLSETKTVPGATIALSVLLWVGALSSTHAAVLPPLTVDQSLIAPEQASLALFNSWGLGQTFTVGTAGTLARVDLQIGRNAETQQPLSFELRTLSGALPNTTPSGLLFSSSIAAAAVPELVFTNNFTVSVDLFSAGIAVTTGQKLAILLTSTDGNWYQWVSGYWPSDYYSGGTALTTRGNGNANWEVTTDWGYEWDSGFRTLVAVPEPATGGLLLLGASGCCVRQRFRRATGK